MKEVYIKDKIYDFLEAFKNKQSSSQQRQDKYDVRFRVMRYLATKRVLMRVEKALNARHKEMKESILGEVYQIINEELR